MGVLTVHLDRIENLKDADGLGKSDPYVQFHLEKETGIFDKSFGTKKSKTIKDACTPVFNETFTFEDIPDDLGKMELHCKVMDDDFGKDDCMGESTIVLSNYKLGPQPLEIAEVVESRGIIFKRKATMYLKISFTK